MLKRATLWLPVRIVYSTCPSEVRAMFVGWLPIGTAVPTVAVSGVIGTIELPTTVDDPDPTLPIRLRENGSYRIWFRPSVITLYTVSGVAFETPPPGAGVFTVIADQPRFASCAAGTVAVSLVALVKLVDRAVPLSITVDPLVNPVPFTVTIVSIDPVCTAAGLIDCTVGTNVNVLPVTVTEALARLLLATGSFSDPITCTVSVDVPATNCCTVNVTVADAPLARLPKWQLTPLLEEHTPADAAMDCSVPALGTTAVSATSVAVDGPAFVIVAVKVDAVPVVAPPVAATLTPRSAEVVDRSLTRFDRRLKIPADVRNANPFVPHRVSLEGYVLVELYGPVVLYTTFTGMEDALPRLKFDVLNTCIWL